MRLPPSRARGTLRRLFVCLIVSCAVLPGPQPGSVALAQHEKTDEPLLASTISEDDIEMRGRWVRQWTEPDGVHVLMFNGGFKLTMGQRRMSCHNAVVWIEQATTGGPAASGAAAESPGAATTSVGAATTDTRAATTQTPPATTGILPEGANAPRPYFIVTVYLSEEAEVVEPAGTITQDVVLLVRGLRTFGQIIKYHDAHAPENMADTPFYQRALRDRLEIELAQEEPLEAESPEVRRPGDVAALKKARSPAIRYRLPNIETADTPDGQRVYVSTGGVYFARDGGQDSAVLEIRADHAVVFPAPGVAATLFGEPSTQPATQPAIQPGAPAAGDRTAPPPPPDQQPPQRPRTSEGPPPQPPVVSAESLFSIAPDGEGRIHAVYLEGDVVLSLGDRFVRASRIFYDFERDRALILDGVFRADIPQRNIPLYIRAEEIRQLSAREFAADNAVVTTSEFYTPHYHVGAERVYVRDITPRDAEGRATGRSRGTYEMRNTTLNIEGLPLLWWPYTRGTLESSETTLRSFSTGASGDRGYEVETRWHLFNLLGVAAPPGVDGTLRADYFSDRGPAVGIDLDYEQKDYYGLIRSYFVYDQGQDNLGPLREDEEIPSTETRGRVLWRHRHYLPNDWELTLEAAYISDDNFMEEWEEDEWFEGKDQETLIYLKRAKDVDAITLLANWRLLDFLTQTEHLPDLVYRRIGDTFLDPLVLYHESRFGMVRYLRDDRLYNNLFTRNIKDSDLTVRQDVREEAEWPFKVGALNVVPFASIRGTYWDGQPRDSGALWRGLGVYGVRGGTMFSRNYDEIESTLFDIHRIRHIIKPEFAAWWSHANVRSEWITPFDYGIETIDPFYGFTAGVKQTWQTKRGPVGNRRTVDLLTLNLEVGYFGDTDGRRDQSNGWANPLRPENSRTRNYFSGDLAWRISDSTALLYDFNIDMDDLSYDRHNIAIAVERDPRLSYVFGVRYLGDIQMALVGGGYNYKINEKHLTAFRGWWDADSGRLGEVTLAYVRKLPRWYMGVNFDYSNVDDDFSITLSFWPEGIPEWALGSRRFTALGSSTGIRP